VALRATHKYQRGAQGRARALLKGARQRAERAGLEFTITQEWVVERIQRGACPLTGSLYDLQLAEGSRCNPNAPSLDRIDNSKGYTRENTRVITWQANVAKSEFTEEFLIQLALGLIANRKQKVHRVLVHSTAAQRRKCLMR